MCCLFGVMDYGGSLSQKEKQKLIQHLSVACEVRGTDATGVAYNSGGHLRIYKRPFPAHFMRIRIPEDARVITGHTRMATQGDEMKNYNNHPFYGRTGTTHFALAHNGVIYNDQNLKRTEKLPATNVETDSFVAVQLVEKSGELTGSSLGLMAEKLHGTFTFTVLDDGDNLWFVKGDNPMCIYHYEKLGLYVYASTKEILERGLKKTFLRTVKPEQIFIEGGDILHIDHHGHRTMERFTFHPHEPFWYRYGCYQWPALPSAKNRQLSYLDELKDMAPIFGYDPSDIDDWSADGYTTDEIEELLYCGAF